MAAGIMRLLGGEALKQRELRVLYAVMFLSFLGASISFPVRILYAQAHHATPAELGIMAAAFILGPLVAQFPMGWLVDRWGRVPVLWCALVGHPIISLLYIFFFSPVDLIALRFIEGVSVAAFRPAINAYIADVTPEEHRSEAYGALGAALNAGMLIGPLIGGLVGQYFGFTAAFAVNVAIELLAIPLLWGRVHEPAEHRARQSGGVRSPVPWSQLISIPLAGAYIAFFSTQIVMGILGSLWTIWIHDLGGSYTYIGVTFTVFALPQIIFGAAAGRWSDRWGRAPMILVGGVLAGLVYMSYGFVSGLVAIAVLGVIEGMLIVVQSPAEQGLLADASPPQARGSAQGIAGAIGSLGGASAAFVCIPLYHYSRPLPFLLAGTAMIVGSIVAAAGAIYLKRRTRGESAVYQAPELVLDGDGSVA